MTNGDLRDEDRKLADLTGAVLAAETDRHRGRDEPEPDPRAPLPGVGTASLSLAHELRRGGVSIFVVLLLLTSLDELEGAVLSVLAPDIRDSFGISDGTIVFLSVAAGAFIVLGAVPMGWLADRFRRGPVIGISSGLFAAMAVLSGFATSAFLFFWARFGAGVAKANAGPVHGSLLADAYPIGVRGRLGASLGVAGRLFGIASPLLAGAIAAAAGGPDGWRWAYWILGLPVAAVALAAFFLPDPPRGQWEKSDVLGTVIEDERPPPISMEAAFARLGRIRTLKTVVLAFAAIGFGLFTTPVLGSLFLADAYGLDAFGRGLVGTAGGAAGLAVLPFVGRYYDRVFRADPARALRLVGLLTIPSAALTPLQYFAPNPVAFTLLGIPQVVLLSSAFTMVGPLLQSVVPYRLRGLGSAMGSVYVFFIGATGGALLAAPLINQFGPRTAILVTLIPATVLGGLLILRSSRFIRNDLALVTAELQEEYAEHTRRTADPASVPLLQCHGLDFSYGRVQVLFDVGFEVRRGEVLALLGTNGAGKSTVLRLLAGLATPEHGVIRLDGRTITFVSPEQRLRLGIVSLAGGAGVFPHLSVDENLRIATFVYRGDPADVTARIDRALALFPQLVGRRRAPARSLSGGEQQMLALAVTLVHDPEVLLIDELSLGLAPVAVAELLAVIDRLRDSGLGIVLVEQSLNVALSIADRAVYLEKGQVRFSGPASELAAADVARAVFLGPSKEDT